MVGLVHLSASATRRNAVTDVFERAFTGGSGNSRRGSPFSSAKETMMDKGQGSADEFPVDAQEIEKGELSDDQKLDIALQGSMMTSEPPQISEPKTTADDDQEED